jgi:predicted ATPase
VVALLVAREGQAVYIEQPEIHLHPRAQKQMAEVLADAARRGVKVIAETHSALLLRAVQTLVAKGELSREIVKLHWFSRDEKNGVTEVRSADLDENGAFGDWPMDFDEVELSSEGDYLDAVETRSR